MFRVLGSGFQGLGFQGLGFRVKGFRVMGFRVKGLRVSGFQGLGFGVNTPKPGPTLQDYQPPKKPCRLSKIW